ncbi:uncharacterized protein LOC113315855 [Papaver somniferum]|uniref:uncharacterized protein LOC113315855 n=1 Tax=Papaver somniferum TaxID=3469 RepID=UPI000E701369|nr:uncharacterized protein LOC113315855 [Papaver somniferum]
MPQTNQSEPILALPTPPKKTSNLDNEFEHISEADNSIAVNVPLPPNVPIAPFPQRLIQQNKSTHYNEMLEMFKRVDINIPFLEAIKQIPAYAKFLKELCTQKRKLNLHRRAFLAEQLGLGELKLTTITLQLADRSVKVPRGRPFLATSNANINCRNRVLKLSFGNMTVELNVFNVSKQHVDLDDNDVHEINMIESVTQDSLTSILSIDPLQACLENFNLEFYDDEYISEVQSLLESVPQMDVTKWQNKVKQLPLSDTKSITSSEESPKQELKTLPSTLKYTFLGSFDTLPVIISSCLDMEQENNLPEVLRNTKRP